MSYNNFPRAKKLLILGAGGHGKVVADIAKSLNIYNEICFLDDNPSLTSIIGLKVLGDISLFTNYVADFEFFVAIGNANLRNKLISNILALNGRLPILIHPSAILGSDVNIGAGTVIMPGAIINASSKIGVGCILNTKCSIDHDCKLEDFVHISPNATLSGSVSIGSNSWVCAGAVISNHVEVCEDVIIGAAAAVIKNISEPGTYVGVPANKIS